jgi:HEAT repeat protein
MTRARRNSTCLICSALLGAAAPARAATRGVLISPAALAAVDREQLQRELLRARRDHAPAFAALRALRQALPRLAQKQRGRVVNAVLPLRSLGAAGALPMLAELAVDAAPRGALSARAWQGWRVSLLEALGSLRDARALPVLEAIFRNSERDAAVLRAAARALGRLGSSRATAALVGALRTTDALRRLAAVAGLGECRNPDAARALAALLRARDQDRALQRAIIAALGDVGNAWAWRTPQLARTGQGDAVRRLALEALVAAYPGLSDDAREAAAKALLLVGHEDSAKVIAAAAERRPAAQAAFDALARRLARDRLGR